ncbi:MAG: hypothetical protein U1F34_01840 [Gammaproteobacteria bacterium]
MPPVIMLTDEERVSIIVKAIKIGAKDYLLKKDLQTVDLASIIYRALGIEGETPSRALSELPIPEVYRRTSRNTTRALKASPRHCSSLSAGPSRRANSRDPLRVHPLRLPHHCTDCTRRHDYHLPRPARRG